MLYKVVRYLNNPILERPAEPVQRVEHIEQGVERLPVGRSAAPAGVALAAVSFLLLQMGRVEQN